MDYNEILDNIKAKALKLVEDDYNMALDYLQTELVKLVPIDINLELKKLYGDIQNVLNENGIFTTKEEFKIFIGFMISYAKGYLMCEYEKLN